MVDFELLVTHAMTAALTQYCTAASPVSELRQSSCIYTLSFLMTELGPE